MRKLVLLLLITNLFFACTKNENTFKITGKINNKKEIKEIYLVKQKGSIKDTLLSESVSSSGEFEIEYQTKSRSFYALETNKGLINIVVSPKEELKITIDENKYADYRSNSADCQLIKDINIELAKIRKSQGDERLKLAKEFKDFYKAKMLKDAFSLSNIFALYAKVENQYIFDRVIDKQLFRTIASALNSMYPNEPYVRTVYKEVRNQFLMEKALKKQNELDKFIAKNAKVIDFPDVDLPNRKGKKVKLSSLKGKYVLLDFWTSNTKNAVKRHPQMKEVYNRYKKKGFEIYQVSFDTNLDVWKQAMDFDGLPWVSVCDTLGGNSPVLGLFNIKSLPKNYLLDRTGKKVIGSNLTTFDLNHKLNTIFK
jgi:peroxiredoxin